MTILRQLQEIWSELPGQTRLVAVSKFRPASVVQEAYDAGQRLFGESRVQEIATKYEQLPKDIIWHFIGHLQTNKVKYIAPFVNMIESVDSLRLLQEIDLQAQKSRRNIPVLLQMHIAREDQKFGFTYEECRKFMKEGKVCRFKNVSIRGLMGMATYTNDQRQIQSEFAGLSAFFKEIRQEYFSGDPDFKELSMGMSDDYRIAITEGSTLIRIGTKIFGERI